MVCDGEQGWEGRYIRIQSEQNMMRTGLGWKNQSRSSVVIARREREKKRLLPPNIPTTLWFICPNEQLLLNPSCYLMGEMGEILYLN